MNITDPNHSRDLSLPGEAGLPLVHSAPTEQELLAIEERESRTATARAEEAYKQRQLGLTETNVWITIVLAVAAIGAAVIYGLQLGEMKRTNELTRTALRGSNDTLNKTLDKMQDQIKATDRQTDELKKQAKASSDAATAAGKQAGAMADLVVVASKQFDSSERPWIQAKVSLDTPDQSTASIGLDRDGNLRVIVQSDAANSGKSPAVDVLTSMRLIGQPPSFPTEKERLAIEQMQQRLCSETRSTINHRVMGNGETIFPGTTLQSPSYLFFKPEEIKAELAHPSNHKYVFTLSKGTKITPIMIGGEDYLTDPGLGSPSAPGLSVAGCITYFAGYSKEMRTTTFLYDLNGFDLRYLDRGQGTLIQHGDVGNRAK
jgi:hypothetical protein